MSETKPKNALSHGAYASDLIFPWEKVEDFKNLHQSLRDELEPDGPAEEAAVHDYALGLWKKRRLEIGLHLAFRAHPDAAALAEAGKKGFEGVVEYLEGLAGAANLVSDAMRNLAKTHAKATAKILESIDAELSRLNGPQSAAAGEEVRTHAEILYCIDQWRQELKALGSDTIVPALEMVVTIDLDQNVVTRAYRPEIMESHLKAMASLDRQCEKALNRLVQLKEYKKFYGKKDVKAIAPRAADSKGEA
jgi:hypothetical protein